MVRTGFGTVLVVMLVATHAHGQIEAPESFIVVADLTGDGAVPGVGWGVHRNLCHDGELAERARDVRDAP